jgi:ribose 5-phosphate isomerase B
MNIYLATDHAGFERKEHIKGFLKNLGYKVFDEGNFSLEPEDDYPDFVKIVSKQVASDPANSRGIVFGGSGQGEAIVCNREKGVRAAVYYGGPLEIITLSRVHNNTNVLSLGARFLSNEQAEEAVKVWLNTDFPAEERHMRRIKKIDSENTEMTSF